MVKNKEKLNEFWKRRYKIEPKLVNWNHEDWAKNRQYHLVFLIRLNEEKEFIKKLNFVKEKLKKFSCIKILDNDYLHITIKPLGFLDNNKVYDDSYSEEDLNNFIEKAKTIFSKTKTFSVELKRLNFFDDCIFIEVEDENKIGKLNREIIEVLEIKKLSRDDPNFIPHIAITHFNNNKDFKEAIKVVEVLRNIKFGKIHIGKVDLVKLDISKGEPKIKPYAEFKLA